MINIFIASACLKRPSNTTKQLKKVVFGLGVVLLVSSVKAEQANIIDGLTYADNCLYMLDSTRQLDQPDCDKLLEWHKKDFPHVPAAEDLETTKRTRFERNLKLYKSTLKSVRKILGSEVAGQ